MRLKSYFSNCKREGCEREDIAQDCSRSIDPRKSHALSVSNVSIIGDICFSKQLYLTRFWSQRSMDRRECDTHISTHARVARIVVVAAAIEKNLFEGEIRLFPHLSNLVNKNVKLLYDTRRLERQQLRVLMMIDK